MINTANITPEESLRQQLETWCFEVGTDFENSSKEAVGRFTTHLPPRSKVVDLGCGDGAATKYFIETGCTVIGVDINKTKLANNTADTVCSTMIDYLKKSKPDNIFTHHTLEHVPNPQEVLDFISKKLKPGGLFYAEVPAGDHLHSVHHATFGDPDDLLPGGFEVLEKGTTGGEHYMIAKKPQ